MQYYSIIISGISSNHRGFISHDQNHWMWDECEWFGNMRRFLQVVRDNASPFRGVVTENCRSSRAASQHGSRQARSSFPFCRSLSQLYLLRILCSSKDDRFFFFFFCLKLDLQESRRQVQPTRGWSVSGWWIRTRHDVFSCSRQRKERKNRQRSTRLFWTWKTRLWS